MAKKATSNGRNSVLRMYRSYNFRDKDPVIDVIRTAKDDAKLRISDLVNGSGVSATTFYNWFDGKTKRPQFATVAASCRAIGGNTVDRIAELLRKGK